MPQLFCHGTDCYRYRSREYDTEDGPWDPISGGAGAVLGTVGSLMMGVADMPVEFFKLFSKSDMPKTTSENRQSSEQSTSGTRSQHASITSSASTSTTDVGALTPSQSNSSLPDVSTPLASPTLERAVTGSGTASPKPMSRTGTDSTTSKHRSSLAEAFQHHRSRSRSPSREPSLPQHHKPNPNRDIEAMIQSGKGVGRMVGEGFKSPMDFTLAVSRGFHNAPKLYGDTVREPGKVTDLQSGLREAGKVR